MKTIEKLENEMRLYIDENQMLHEELKLRPLKVEVSCDLVSYNKHKENEKQIAYLIYSEKEFYVNAKKEESVLSIRPFKYDVDGFFYGLVVGISGISKVKVFDIVIFGSYDLYEFNL